MVDSTKSGKPAFLGAAFDEFLFVSIGADASGTPVTVVSALARLDLDPWDEAANLTRLPGAVATQKLAEMISRFPEVSSVRIESLMIARRLTALLPGRIRSDMATPEIPVRNLPAVAHALTGPRFILSLLFIAMAAFFIAQVVMGQFHPVKIPSTQTVVSTTALAKKPLPGIVDIGKIEQ